MKSLFKGAVIITVNENFDIITNGMLAIKDKQIKYVGEYSSEYEKEFDADSIIYASNKIIMPGFINMHTHLPMTLFRGYASDLPIDKWFNEKILPAEEKMSEQDVRAGAQTAAAEMLLSGTTMCVDTYTMPETVASVLDEGGIRGVV